MQLRFLKKDYNYRLIFLKYEKKKLLIKSLYYSNILSLNKKFLLSLLFYSLPIKSSITKIKNRCIYTGRSRGIISKYKTSRHILKKLVNNSYIFTLKKK